MRIRRRPSQIAAPASSDPAAGVGCSGGGAGAGTAVGKGETVMGLGGLHPSMEVRQKGRRPWGEDSIICRLGKPGGGGGRVGGWAEGGSDASCYGEVQQLKRQKGKVTEKEDSVRDAEKEAEEEKDQKPGAARSLMGTQKTWNHHFVAGGVDASSAAAAAIGCALDVLYTACESISQRAAPFASATGGATISHSGFAGSARKMKKIAWSSGCSRSAGSPSSSSSSIKTEISNGGVIAGYMHGGDHQLMMDEEEKNIEDQQLVSGDNTVKKSKNNSGKRRRSPAVLMEGSRCSRVNGRGWRCSQQTLVGYSLCEHHLGKGRLRSVSTVRCKKAGGGSDGKAIPNQSMSAVEQHQSLANVAIHAEVEEEHDDDEDDEIKLSAGTRRGKRIGTVKARSISSLLDQTSSDVVNHAGVIQEALAPKMVLTSTSTGLPDTLIRTPVENLTPATANAASPASLPRPTTALQEGISAVM